MAKKKNRRWLSVGISLGLGVSSACNNHQESPPPPSLHKPTPGDAPSAPAVNLEAISNAAQYAVAPYAVDTQQFARRVLYTWTTKEQLDSLRQRPVLLTRSESPELGPSGFDQRVAAERGANYEMTQLLQRPQLSLRRFAWPVSWATALGFKRERYGDQLIKITLKEDALIAAYTPADDIHWRLAELSQQPVSRELLREHPERLAAVYYEAADEDGALLYREYVLCNESMIERWEYATPQLLEALSQEEEALRKLSAWAKVAPDPKEVERFFTATAAFPGSPYTAAPTELDALADILLVQKGSQSSPLSITPDLDFNELNAAPTPAAKPAIVAPPCYDSYCPPPKPKPVKPKPKSTGTF